MPLHKHSLLLPYYSHSASWLISWDCSSVWCECPLSVRWCHALVSCSPHPSLSYSLSDAESESENSTATRRAKMDATSCNAFTRSTSFCSFFSTFLSLIPEERNKTYICQLFWTSITIIKLLLHACINIFIRHNLPSRIALSKSLLGSKAGAGGLAGLLRVGLSVLGGDCFGGDVEIIYKYKRNSLCYKIYGDHELHIRSLTIQ